MIFFLNYGGAVCDVSVTVHSLTRDFSGVVVVRKSSNIERTWIKLQAPQFATHTSGHNHRCYTPTYPYTPRTDILKHTVCTTITKPRPPFLFPTFFYPFAAAAAARRPVQPRIGSEGGARDGCRLLHRHRGEGSCPGEGCRGSGGSSRSARCGGRRSECSQGGERRVSGGRIARQEAVSVRRSGKLLLLVYRSNFVLCSVSVRRRAREAGEGVNRGAGRKSSRDTPEESASLHVGRAWGIHETSSSHVPSTMPRWSLLFIYHCRTSSILLDRVADTIPCPCFSLFSLSLIPFRVRAGRIHLLPLHPTLKLVDTATRFVRPRGWRGRPRRFHRGNYRWVTRTRGRSTL